MDYVDSLLIMEDDTDEEPTPMDSGPDNVPLRLPHPTTPPHQPDSEPVPEWCVCNHCQVMSQEIENICCKKKECVTTKHRSMKLCIDPDVLELCIKNNADIKYDRENNTTRSFRKSAYRQYILDKYGYLGKGNRRVAPSCVVWKIRRHYPSTTGVYMGFKH